MPSWDSEFAFLKDRYENGGDLQSQLNPVFYAAGYFLASSEIFKNLDYAMTINSQLERLRRKKSQDGELMASLHLLFARFYKHTIDDTAIVSAFENYAKGMLLKRRFIPHVITSPKEWKEEQQQSPIHFLKYRAAIRKGVKIKLSDKTLAVSTLSKDSYLNKIGYSQSHKLALDEIIASRNKMHFMGLTGYSLKGHFFEHIVYLHSLIKKQTNRRFPYLFLNRY